MERLHKYITTAFVLLLACSPAAGEEKEYVPMLTDGKVWEVLDQLAPYSYAGNNPNAVFAVSVEGDVVENGITCKKLKALYHNFDLDNYATFGTYFLAYEKDGVLYVKSRIFNTDSFIPVADFNASDRQESLTGVAIKETVEKEVKGIDRKCLKLDADDDYAYWIEGIGPSVISENTVYLKLPDALKAHRFVLLRCYDKDKLIYSKGEFVHGTEPYMPMFTEGKRWEMIDVYEGHEEFNSIYNITVKGDEKINGVLCKRLEIETPEHLEYTPFTEVAYGYEEDGVLYDVNSVFAADGFNGTFEFMDLNMKEGDVFLNGSRKIFADDIIERYGVKRKRLTFGTEKSEKSGIYEYWVEGIGLSDKMAILTTFPSPLTCKYNTYINKCFQDDELIFTRDDFADATGVDNLNIGEPDTVPVYNLQGIQIDRPAPGEIYICNGKKFINR